MNLIIDNYYELIALHKTIMSAKFDPDPWVNEIQGSPLSASIAMKTFNLIVEWCIKDGKDKEAQEWVNWQNADENRRETKLLIDKMNTENWWKEANQDIRREYIINFMSPLKLETKLLEKLIKYN